jgi:hypothetical protein
MHDTVVAVFSGEREAMQARAALLSEGFPESLVTLSVNLTSDGIAAEAPGQAYANQTSEVTAGLRRLLETGLKTVVDEDTADANRMADLQRGTVVLSVGPLSGAERDRAAAILERERPVSLWRD